MKNETLPPAVEAFRAQLGHDKFEELVHQMFNFTCKRLFGHPMSDQDMKTIKYDLVRAQVIRTMDKHCQEQ